MMTMQDFDEMAAPLIDVHKTYEARRIVAVALCELQKSMTTDPKRVEIEYGTELELCINYLVEQLPIKR